MIDVFDEFFSRRRNSKGMYWLMIGFIALGALLIALGVAYLL